MSIHLRVYCRSLGGPTRRDLARFIEESSLLDAPLTFTPAPDDPAAADPDWGRMTLWRAGHREPLSLDCVAGDELGLLKLESIAEARATGRDSIRVLHGIATAAQVYLLELGDDPPADVWEALEAVERLLARQGDGIIEAREGLYDASFARIDADDHRAALPPDVRALVDDLAGDAQRRALTLRLLCSSPRSEPAVVAATVRALDDTEPCVLQIPWRFGEVRALAARALARLGHDLPTVEQPSLDSTQIAALERQHDLPHLDPAGVDASPHARDLEGYRRLRDRGLVTAPPLAEVRPRTPPFAPAAMTPAEALERLGQGGEPRAYALDDLAFEPVVDAQVIAAIAACLDDRTPCWLPRGAVGEIRFAAARALLATRVAAGSAEAVELEFVLPRSSTAIADAMRSQPAPAELRPDGEGGRDLERLLPAFAWLVEHGELTPVRRRLAAVADVDGLLEATLGDGP